MRPRNAAYAICTGIEPVLPQKEPKKKDILVYET